MLKNLHKPIFWLIVIAIPIFLGMGMIRAVIAWDYPSFEYARIAPDAYGFTDEERLTLAHATLDYLQRREPAEEVIYLLEDLRLPGTDEPLYNEREIGHMLDVKNLTDIIGTLFILSAVILIGGLTFLIASPETRPLGYQAIFRGGLATVAILAVLGLIIGLAWPFFFVTFHELLFPPGTWTFSYSDSLIRLFPEQFWFDVGIIISGGTLALGAVVALVGYLLKRSSRTEGVHSFSKQVA